MKSFRSYQLAVAFYRTTSDLRLPRHLQDQFARAASSIALNLAEGRGRRTTADQRQFFQVPLGSIRECQAILDLYASQPAAQRMAQQLDTLGASVYLLIRNAR